MNIWVPRTKIIEPKEALSLVSRVQGFFRLEVYRPDGRKRLDTGFFPNLILDQGLNTIGTTGGWLGACRVGTGNTAPANGQTNLISHVAGTSTTQASNTGAQSSAPYYGWMTKTYRFSPGAAAGNLAEVGIGTSTSNGANLFSRALILDGALSPTTLTVLSDEFLDVTYELRVYAPPSDGAGTIMISSSNYDYVSRASQANSAGVWSPGTTGFSGGGGGTSSVTAYSGAIGAITSTPAGSQSSQTPSDIAYSDSTYRRDFTASWGLNDANFGGSGITAFRTAFQCGAMQYGLTPGIAKDATKTLAMTFRHTWGRH